MENQELAVLSAERLFFNALIANPLLLDQMLTDDCLLIDVLSGSEVTKEDLVTVLASGQLKFESIEPQDSRLRLYDGTAIVTGSTIMAGRFGLEQFSVHSRYTHVYRRSSAKDWQLVSAQGTPIKN